MEAGIWSGGNEVIKAGGNVGCNQDRDNKNAGQSLDTRDRIVQPQMPSQLWFLKKRVSRDNNAFHFAHAVFEAEILVSNQIPHEFWIQNETVSANNRGVNPKQRRHRVRRENRKQALK